MATEPYYQELYKADPWQIVQNPMALELMVTTLKDLSDYNPDALPAYQFAKELFDTTTVYRQGIAQAMAEIAPLFKTLEEHHLFEHHNPLVQAALVAFAQRFNPSGELTVDAGTLEEIERAEPSPIPLDEPPVSSQDDAPTLTEMVKGEPSVPVNPDALEPLTPAELAELGQADGVEEEPGLELTDAEIVERARGREGGA